MMRTGIDCRGDLRSPAQKHLIAMPHHGELEMISVWQGGRPKVAPTAGLCAGMIRPGMEAQSVLAARSSRASVPTQAAMRIRRASARIAVDSTVGEGLAHPGVPYFLKYHKGKANPQHSNSANSPSVSVGFAWFCTGGASPSPTSEPKLTSYTPRSGRRRGDRRRGGCCRRRWRPRW